MRISACLCYKKGKTISIGVLLEFLEWWVTWSGLSSFPSLCTSSAWLTFLLHTQSFSTVPSKTWVFLPNPTIWPQPIQLLIFKTVSPQGDKLLCANQRPCEIFFLIQNRGVFQNFSWRAQVNFLLKRFESFFFFWQMCCFPVFVSAPRRCPFCDCPLYSSHLFCCDHVPTAKCECSNVVASSGWKVPWLKLFETGVLAFE